VICFDSGVILLLSCSQLKNPRFVRNRRFDILFCRSISLLSLAYIIATVTIGCISCVHSLSRKASSIAATNSMASKGKQFFVIIRNENVKPPQSLRQNHKVSVLTQSPHNSKSIGPPTPTSPTAKSTPTSPPPTLLSSRSHDPNPASKHPYAHRPIHDHHRHHPHRPSVPGTATIPTSVFRVTAPSSDPTKHPMMAAAPAASPTASRSKFERLRLGICVGVSLGGLWTMRRPCSCVCYYDVGLQQNQLAFPFL
jgi:hypothetical protein